MNKAFWFSLGWFFGSSIMWWWFYHNKLIRTRDEWFKARNKNNDNLFKKDD